MTFSDGHGEILEKYLVFASLDHQRCTGFASLMHPRFGPFQLVTYLEITNAF